MLALLKDFDLAWPRVTTTAMSWSETANLGIAVTAPQCYWPGFGFYHNWALTMTFPARRPHRPPSPPPPLHARLLATESLHQTWHAPCAIHQPQEGVKADVQWAQCHATLALTLARVCIWHCTGLPPTI